MTLTRAGRGLALMAVLTLAAAASSGNNLLYLLYSAAVATLLLSWIVGRWNLASIEAASEVPDQIFQGSEFPLTLRLSRRGMFASSLLHARWGNSNQTIDRLDCENPVEASLRVRTHIRGLSRIEDLSLESPFPFGIFVHRKSLAPVTITAYPRLREIRSPQEILSITETGGELAMRKGSGDEFYGVREYNETDDTRWINWKLTAKLGRPLITEFASPIGAKVTVRLDSLGTGAEGERRIEEAASACRYFIDCGAEVRLVTPEAEEEYGKGLLHLDRLFRALALVGEGKTPRPCKPASGLKEKSAGDPVLMRRVTWIGAAIVYASMFLIDEIQPWLLAVMGAVMLASLWVQERDGPWLPKPFWDGLSLAALGFVTLADWRLSGIILMNTHLVTYLIANRLLNPLRDESLGQTFVILFLSFFLISGQTISLWYFLSFICFTAFAVLWLMFAAGARPSHWRLWTPSVIVSWLLMLGLTALCFAVTPRFDTWYQKNPLSAVIGLDKLRAQSGAVSGFTENVSLGFFGQLKLSAARVMRVTPRQAGVQPPPSLYIRGAAFDHFDGRRWSKTPINFRYRFKNWTYRTLHGRGWLPRNDNRLVFPSPSSSRTTLNLDFLIFPLNTAVVFTVGKPLAIEGAEGTANFDATDSLYFNSPHYAGTRYRLLGNEDTSGFGTIIEKYPQLVHSLFLQIPKNIDPRTIELARHLTLGSRDGNAKIQAVQAYLRKGYRYSAFSKNATANLDNFLFSVKSGNCEYFASAGAILLRLAGVPTRLVAGFLAEDWNEYGRFFDVRQSEAHAWVEAYVNGQWILVDPTPPEAFSIGNNLMDRLSRAFNAVQARWYEHVIGYDSYVQRNSFYRLGLGTARLVLEKIVRVALYLVVSLSLLFAIAGLLSWGLRRLRAPRGPYYKAQAALERAGFKREVCQTPKEFAAAVSVARPTLRSFNELADWHYKERYGGRTLTPDEQLRGENLLREIKNQL